MKLVKAFRSFYIPPEPYWYLDAPRSAGEGFDLDNPEHYAYLQRKGICQVELNDGSKVILPRP